MRFGWMGVDRKSGTGVPHSISASGLREELAARRSGRAGRAPPLQWTAVVRELKREPRINTEGTRFGAQRARRHIAWGRSGCLWNGRAKRGSDGRKKEWTGEKRGAAGFAAPTSIERCRCYFPFLGSFLAFFFIASLPQLSFWREPASPQATLFASYTSDERGCQEQSVRFRK